MTQQDITDQLVQRRARAPDYARQSAVLEQLIEKISTSDTDVLAYLSDQALSYCNAQSAGLSIMIDGDEAEAGFEWLATSEKCIHLKGHIMPQDSPATPLFGVTDLS